jgi:hypothetical protein
VAAPQFKVLSRTGPAKQNRYVRLFCILRVQHASNYVTQSTRSVLVKRKAEPAQASYLKSLEVSSL